MAKGLVLLICDEHDLPSLINRMPAESIYVETCVSRGECAQMPTSAMVQQILEPMLVQLRQQQEWPRG